MDFGVFSGHFYHGKSVGAGSPKVKIWKFFHEQIRVGPLYNEHIYIWEKIQLGADHMIYKWNANWNILRNTWGTWWEPLGNSMGTHWWQHIKSGNWLMEFYITREGIGICIATSWNGWGFEIPTYWCVPTSTGTSLMFLVLHKASYVML
jgi:hypothetical protein